MGINTYSGAPNKTCFEPIDDFKGDIARSFFYIATRYMFEDENFQENFMTFKSQLQPWALNMLLEWHQLDPVNQKEIDRNDAIYAVQKNRNPFIDHPEWIEKIWTNDSIYPIQITQENLPEKPKIKWAALTDNRTLKLTFTRPMVVWTIENPLNYYIGESVSVTSLQSLNDTLVIHFGGLFSQNVTYTLYIKHLLAKNMAFLNDTTISFVYPYAVEQKPLLAWTFDNLPAKPNTPKRVSAQYYLFSSVSEAVLYCDGTYKSSFFECNPNNSTELDAMGGNILGDPRPQHYSGNAIAFSNTTANGKSVVFKFPTKGYFNLALSMAVRRTNTGFNMHQWEWSLDGETYTLIDNPTTCPSIPGNFMLTTLDLRTINELDDKEEVFLRLTLHGCTGATGNNRFDNITLRGISIHENSIDTQKKSHNQFYIAPNPNRGQFHIHCTNSNDLCNINYIIFNSFGQEVKTGNLDHSIIDISNQPNGIYFCQILGASLKILKY